MSDHANDHLNDRDSRYDDLERTDVLPQLALHAESPESHESDDNIDKTTLLQQPRLTERATTPFGVAAKTNSANGRISAMPAKPSTTDLAVGGIRGKIADLEHRLVEAQDHQIALKHHCDQLTQRYRTAEERAAKAEKSFVQQAADVHRMTQSTSEAQQRLHEERVRFQAQLVEVERQLLDARMRGDKRAAALEQLLNDQTAQTALNERAAAEARVELHTARGELTVLQASIGSLEERLAEQTRAAAEVTRLYSQQTSQAAASSALVADVEKQLAELQSQKSDTDEHVARLEGDVRRANAVVAELQSDIAAKLRHIAALEHGLEHRDRSIDELKTRLATHDHLTAERSAANTALSQRCAELEKAAADARSQSATAEHEIARLNNALRGNDVRINELAATVRDTERALKDREAAIAEACDSANKTRDDYSQASQKIDELRQRLDARETQIGTLQTQLAAATAELTAAQDSARNSQSLQTDIVDEVRKLEAELTAARQTMESVMAERNQLEIENQSGRAELSSMQSRYDEAVQTILAVRESIAARDQKNASLERELRAAALRLDDANSRIERAATAAEEINTQLRLRDNRIAVLEQQCADNASALSAISQDIERVSSVNPSERLAAMGYTLESLDQAGVSHRINRATTTVGRVGTNDIAIDSSSVSRYHARIVVQPEGVWLIDLQSTNGCGVNGRRINRQILCDGDAVTIGHCKFRFTALSASKQESSEDAFPLLDEPVLLPAAHAVHRDASREQRH